ncbi:MAG: response regulator [Ignavibacteriae bacterium]|nr:response regulator [Ignavibacteriota bacterium]
MKDDIKNNVKVNNNPLKEIASKSILVVEDEFVSRQLICKILRSNFEVEAVETAEECFNRVSEKEYSLIFMDINLGHGISGLEAVKLLRSNNQHAKIPIVATTAFTMPGDKEEFLDAGCSDYLSKPFTKEKLLNILKGFNLL